MEERVQAATLGRESLSEEAAVLEETAAEVEVAALVQH